MCPDKGKSLQLQTLLGMCSAPSLCQRPVCTGNKGCSTLGSAFPSHCPSHGSSDLQGFAGCPQSQGCSGGDRSTEPHARQAGRTGHRSLLLRLQAEMGSVLGAALGEMSDWATSGRFAGFGFFFFILLAKQLSKTPGCGKARTAQVSPQGPACSTRSGSGEQKREQQGCKKKGGEKKKKKKKDINSLGNTRPQGRETVRGTTAHVTGDRQTDSPVPIRYVKYHHSGTLTDL